MVKSEGFMTGEEWQRTFMATAPPFAPKCTTAPLSRFARQRHTKRANRWLGFGINGSARVIATIIRSLSNEMQ